MPIEPPAVSTLPPAPIRGQAGFSAAVAAFLEALPQWGDDVGASGDATYANAQEVFESATEIAAAADLAAASTGLYGRSTSSLTVVPGTKTIHLQSPGAPDLEVNDQVAIILAADPSIRMLGTIATFDGTDDMTVTVVSSGVFGSGVYSSWIVMSAAFLSAGATDEELWAGETDAAVLTPKSLRDAKAWVSLVDGATVTPDGESGRNFTWTIGGNRTLGAITNCGVNDTFLLEITQDGTGSRILAWASGVYYRAGGLPVLSTTAAAKDYLQLRVISVDGSGTATRVVATFLRNPTNA